MANMEEIIPWQSKIKLLKTSDQEKISQTRNMEPPRLDKEHLQKAQSYTLNDEELEAFSFRARIRQVCPSYHSCWTSH